MPDVAIQLGMFGAPATITDVHVVAAHTRVLTNGDSVFVAEHLRWNRGRQTGSGRTRSETKPSPANDPQQPSLFEVVVVDVDPPR